MRKVMVTCKSSNIKGKVVESQRLRGLHQSKLYVQKLASIVET